MTKTFYLGQRVSFESATCTIRYIGPVEGFQKEWLGVEWDDPSRGKHDGVINGVRYFECHNPSPTVASFVRPTRKQDLEQSFVDAVHQKYATGTTARQPTTGVDKQIMISGGKVAEEVGFDKIRAQLAQLNELKIVLVDGLQIATAETPDKLIKNICPKIIELDLSRNLFGNCREIVRICNELDNLRLLRLNGNRLTVKLEDLLIAPAALEGLQELEMDETYLSFSTICQVAKRSRSLKTLTASSNGLGTLDAVEPDPYCYFETGNFPISPGTTLESAEYGLTSISLEYNNFTLLSDLLPLTNFQALEKIHLKGNKISKIQKSIKRDFGGHDTSIKKVVFGHRLRYVDLSYNAVKTWGFLDDLAVTFPGLTALRFSHNPLYDAIAQVGGTAVGVEDGYMLTLARLANLETLNFSNITTAERTNAEMFYLSTIGKEMAEVPEDEERKIISRHKRYQELCDIYGAPSVIRKTGRALNLEFLESRLINFTFFRKMKTSDGKDEVIEKSAEIPKGFDMYKVKGLVGKLFCVRPLSMRLIWETGEWDPVAGYEEQEDDSEEDEKLSTSEKELTKGSNHGKWMKREVELEDSTRQVGFCIDGMDARVRVEER